MEVMGLMVLILKIEIVMMSLACRKVEEFAFTQYQYVYSQSNSRTFALYCMYILNLCT